MPSLSDELFYLLVVVAVIAMFFVLRIRRRQHADFLQQFSDDEVCEHLRPALDLLRSRGHQVVRAGQKNPELPLEIHLAPEFDPHAVAKELELQPPVYVSDRRVLYCKEDWCELHPLR